MELALVQEEDLQKVQEIEEIKKKPLTRKQLRKLEKKSLTIEVKVNTKSKKFQDELQELEMKKDTLPMTEIVRSKFDRCKNQILANIKKFKIDFFEIRFDVATENVNFDKDLVEKCYSNITHGHLLHQTPEKEVEEIKQKYKIIIEANAEFYSNIITKDMKINNAELNKLENYIADFTYNDFANLDHKDILTKYKLPEMCIRSCISKRLTEEYQNEISELSTSLDAFKHSKQFIAYQKQRQAEYDQYAENIINIPIQNLNLSLFDNANHLTNADKDDLLEFAKEYHAKIAALKKEAYRNTELNVYKKIFSKKTVEELSNLDLTSLELVHITIDELKSIVSATIEKINKQKAEEAKRFHDNEYSYYKDYLKTLSIVALENYIPKHISADELNHLVNTTIKEKQLEYNRKNEIAHFTEKLMALSLYEIQNISSTYPTLLDSSLYLSREDKGAISIDCFYKKQELAAEKRNTAKKSKCSSCDTVLCYYSNKEITQCGKCSGTPISNSIYVKDTHIVCCNCRSEFYLYENYHGSTPRCPACR